MKAQWRISALLSALLLSGPVATPVAAQIQQETVVMRLAAVRYCDAFSGANAGAKIAACVADLPSTGGVADARGFQGAQTISSTITFDRPIVLLLGHAIYTCSVPANNPCLQATDKRGIRILGASASETFIAGASTTEGTKFIWAGSGTTALMKFTGVENLEIADLSLDGNNVASSIGIELLTSATVDTSSVFLRRLTVAYFNKGVKLSASGASNVDVSMLDDVTLRQNGKGLTFESAQAVGWALRELRFIDNTTALETINGGGFHCLNCSWSGGTTAALLTIITDSITFQNNTWEMSTGQTAISASYPATPRLVTRVVGSRLDKSGTLGQNLIVWTAGGNLHLEGNRIKDGKVSLNNAAGGEAIHTAIGNIFEGTTANANWLLNTPAGADVYNLYEFGTMQTADLSAGTRPVARHRRATSAGIVTVWQAGSQFLASDGTVSSPSYSFASETNTGINKIGGDGGLYGTASGTHVFRALGGGFRLGPNELCWGAAVSGACDLSLTRSAADVLLLGAGDIFKADAHVTSAANPAASGLLRGANTDAVKNRNNANSADVTLIDKNTSDQVRVGPDAAGVKIGDNSNTAAVRGILTGTGSLDFTALAANSCEVLTITAVTGAADGDAVKLGVPDALADVDGATERTTFFAWAVADAVRVRRCNVTGTVTAEPAAATLRAEVTKF